MHDGDGGAQLPPLVAWELFMRGAGRAERTVCDGLRVMRMLERHADKPVEHLASVDVSRFLARPELKPSSRASYFGSIAAFFKWYGDSGDDDIAARLPHPARRKAHRALCRALVYAYCSKNGCMPAHA